MGAAMSKMRNNDKDVDELENEVVEEKAREKKKPANYYYDNDKVQGWVEEYLTYDHEDRKSDPHCLVLRERTMVEVGKVVNGIIFKHKFTIWEPYDDLYQEAMEACTKALEKFDPTFITSKGEKATTFNYFSLTAKRCLKFYTMRNQKNRNNYGIDDYANTLSYSNELSENSTEIVSSEFIKHLKEIFLQAGHKKFIPIIDILQEYLEKIGAFNKRDFFRFAKSYGWSPNLIRKFLKIIKDNKDEFYRIPTA